MMHLSIPRALGCLAVVGLIQLNIAQAQCPGGANYTKLIYSTTKIGNANNLYTLGMFDPTLGTLYSAQFTSVIYFRYAYTLTNSGTSPESYTINVNREDSMFAYTPSHPDMMGVDGYTLFRQIKYNPGAGTGVHVGETDTSVIITNPMTKNTTFNQSLVPFMGSDSLYIVYRTFTESQAGGPTNNFNVAISNTAAKDSIILSITYSYCPSTTLASNLLTLSSKRQDSNVVLTWNSQDTYSDGYYEILKSTDARSYTSISRQAINRNKLNDYNYLYKPLATDGTTGFFRIKQTNKDGDVIYSRVITVALPENANTIAEVPTSTDKLTVFPTITKDFVNLALPESNVNDEWQISIVSLTGQVLQKSTYTGNGQLRIAFNNALPSGMNIVSAVNKRTNTIYKGKIIVQN